VVLASTNLAAFACPPLWDQFEIPLSLASFPVVDDGNKNKKKKQFQKVHQV
jgi:hypothetical protein